MKVQKLYVANNHLGTMTLLHKYELIFVATFTQMSRMRWSLSPSQCVALINSMISDTEKGLIAFISVHYVDAHGEISKGYWQAFKNRNGHLICSKRGQI